MVWPSSAMLTSSLCTSLVSHMSSKTCYFLWWMSPWLSTFPLVGELTTNTHTICFRADEFGVTLMLRGPLPHTVDTGTSPEQSSQCADQRTPGEHSGVPRSIYNCRTVQLLLLLGGVYQSLTSLTSKFSFVALPSPFSSLPLQRHPLKSKKRARTPLKSRTRAKPPTKTGATADPSRVLLR